MFERLKQSPSKAQRTRYARRAGVFDFTLGLARRAVRGRRAFAADRRGVAAVEFALIAPPFMYLLTGILEMAMMFFTITVVDGAVQDAGRQIRTGQAQLSGDTLTTFQNQLCASLGSVYDCNSMTFDVRTYTSFSGIAITTLTYNEDGDLVDEDGNVVTTEFAAGGSGEITVVRVIYGWSFFTPMIGELFNSPSGTRLLSSTTVFRNEPYE